MTESGEWRAMYGPLEMSLDEANRLERLRKRFMPDSTVGEFVAWLALRFDEVAVREERKQREHSSLTGNGRVRRD